MKRKKGGLVSFLVLLTVLLHGSYGNPTSSRDHRPLEDLPLSSWSEKDQSNNDNTITTTTGEAHDENGANDDLLSVDNMNALIEELPSTNKDAPQDDDTDGEYSIGSDIIEGDIKTTQEQAAMFKKGGWDALVGSQAWYPEHGKWSRTIPYVIDDNIYDHVRNSIRYSMGIFHQYTCLRFVPKQDHHRDYLNFVNKRGCWSQVGRRGGRQEISLAKGCYSAVPAHEIMHALGRFHEQSRPDRNSYVEIKQENIKTRALSNFRIQRNADTQGIPYDYGSVMHYSSHAFTRNRRPTIIPKVTGYRLGQRGTVSPSDILHINIRYCQENMIRLAGGPGPFEGRVEVNWKGQWGTVCDDLFGLSDGHAICRYLGYPKALRVYKKGNRFGKGQGPIWFDNMDCQGNEYSPFSCRMNEIGSHNCQHSEDAGVTCQNNIRLIGSDSHSTDTTSGRVQVYFRGKWGTICHDTSFDSNAAHVICRQLGKSRVKRVYHMTRSQEEGSESTVWLSGVKCTGGESQIGFCRAEPLGDLKEACSHDVAVHCL